MTVVVADTSPINYLVLIGAAEVREQLYRQIVIPEDVFIELTDRGAPSEVREWAANYPDWVEVRNSPRPDAALRELDAGEAAAITLAEMETDVLLLMDEAAGRLEASRRGIPNTGTLGVLRRAAIDGFVDLREALDRLTATNFRVPRALIEELLAEDRQRRRQGS